MKTLFTLFAIILIFSSIIFAQDIPTQWHPRGVGGGGALFNPSISPFNENEFYLSCDMSEYFHTTDFGKSYSQLPYNKIESFNNTAIRFTSDPYILYATHSGESSYQLLKSTDNGNNWILLKNNPLNGDEPYYLFADNTTSKRFVVSGYSDAYISLDGGNVFKKMFSAKDNGMGIIIGGVFWDGSDIYIGTNDGLYVSHDGGSTFKTEDDGMIPSSEHIFSFTGSKNQGITRFVCVTGSDIYAGKQGSDYYNFTKGVYVMDYPNSWQKKMTGIDITKDFLLFCGMALQDINNIYLGGSSSSSNPNVIKSSDGGNTWKRVFNSTGNANIYPGWQGTGGDKDWTFGECLFQLAVAPNNSSKIVITDFGYCHTSTDGGATWNQAYTNTASPNQKGVSIVKGKPYSSIGLENTTNWQVFWFDKTTMFAAYSDIRGILSTDAGNTWSFNYTGSSANSIYRIAKDSSGNLFAATSNIHDMYQSTRLKDAQLDANDANGKIIYSTDKGSTWKDMKVFNHPVFWLTIDPNNPTTMYASVISYASGQGGIWVSKDISKLAGATWTKLPNPPRTEGHPASIVVLNDGNLVCTYSARQTSAGKFTASSGVFLYNPNTNTWTDLSSPSLLYWCKDIVIDPNDPNQNTWYVGVFSGWGGNGNNLGGLYKTSDRGKNWVQKFGTYNVTSLTFNPKNIKEAYLTTEQNGLWVNGDMTASNGAFQSVTSYPFKQPERVYFNPYNTDEVWISSFGNGIKMGTQGNVTPTYNITAEAFGNGKITPTGVITLNQGGFQKFTFTPNSGAVLTDVLVDSVSVGNSLTYTFSNITKNHTITANFMDTIATIKHFIIEASVDSGSVGKGTITPNGNIIVKQGDSISFSITPALNCKILDVKVNRLSVGNVNQYSFKNIQGDQLITAYFVDTIKSNNQFIIEATVDSNSIGKGTITPNGKIKVNKGDSTSFTISPANNCKISTVYINGFGIGNIDIYTFKNVQADNSIRVTFDVEDTTMLSIEASQNNDGIVSPAGKSFYKRGTDVKYDFIASKGAIVFAYQIDSAKQVSLLQLNTSLYSYTFKNIQSNHTIFGIFGIMGGVDYSEELKIDIIYPNPVSELIHLNFSDLSQFNNFYIYDLLGQNIMSGGLSSNKIDVKMLGNGEYFLILRNEKDKKEMKSKFIKSK